MKSLDISKSFSKEIFQILEYCLHQAFIEKRDFITEWDIFLYILKYPTTAQLVKNITSEDIETINKEIKRKIVESDKPTLKIPTGSVIISPEAQKYLYCSFLCAAKYSRSFVYPEDLLLSADEIPTLSVLVAKYNFDFKKLENLVLEKLGGQQSTLSDNSTPLLNKYSHDLTALAKDGLVHKAIGREKEIQQLIRILSRESKSNAILLGEAGVGKTAVVEGLATLTVNNELHNLFDNVRVISLNLIAILAAASTRGAIEDLVGGIIDEVKRAGNIILFIDEIHLITGGANTNEATIISNILKPSLARGELHVIGATTLSEYRKYIEKDPALSRRFEPIRVEEPNIENSILICIESAKRLSKYHKLEISQKAITSAVELSKRYITDRFLPDKAIDLLDEAASHANLESRKVVDENDVKIILAERTGIPIQKLSESESDKLSKLEEIINKTLIGQDEAVKDISEVIRRSRAGLKDPKKPIGSFLFLGASGVGKTELAKQISRIVYDTEKAMIRLDMSEFGESHTVQRLIGAPPGYVGYEEGGQLTNPVWERPYSLILLDEIEKANPKIFDIFLQVLDDGRLTDGQGRTVDFRNTIIIATSNIASDEIIKDFEAHVNIHEEIYLENTLIPILREYFRPEFINRFDDIVVFNPLSKIALKEIAKINLIKIEEKLKDKNIKIQLNDEVLNKIVEETYNLQFGARPTIRFVQEKIENKIARDIIEGKILDNSTIDISKIYYE